MRARWGIGLLFVWAASVCAESVDDLYQTHIIVPLPQNPKETQAVLREAFLTEVVRVSGQPQTRENKIILSKADKADAYINRYNYTNTEKITDPQKIPNTQLNVTFAPHLIDKLLSDAKLSSWVTDRPLLLVLVKDEDNGFASTSQPKTISKQLQQALNQRGVIYKLPNMDADDLLELGATFATPSDDQWALLQKRYRYQAALIGDLVKNDKDGAVTWSGQWQLIMDNHTIPIDQADSDQQTVITQIVDQVADVLATAAAQANKARTFMVTVNGIEGDEAYNKVREYLEKFTSPQNIKFVKTQDKTVVYQVTSKPTLVKTIAEEKSILLPDAQHPNTDAELFYSFNDVP